MAVCSSKPGCRHGRVTPLRWLASLLILSSCSSTLHHVAFCGMRAKPLLRRSTPCGASPTARHAGRLAFAKSKSAEALEVLGLPEGATQAEVKTRYRTLVAAEHPDKNPDDPQAPKKFSKIVAAYQQLTEPQEQPLDQFPDVEVVIVDDEVPTWWRPLQKASGTLAGAAVVLIVLGFLTVPLGFWAKEEITAKCTTAALDKQWCDQLVQFRCAGQVFLGERDACLVDAQRFMDGSIAGSREYSDDDGALLQTVYANREPALP
eukprot:TRINITY_DN1178_c1_g1_i1.p1 TRINITY_DN1178_c1_g1~~TRINITY_DN1178_c1_g1_i1.p1  ORF type:complete len:283 (-),score=19.98 TRINITY_DN1178_c1_g1_i1:255-1040(-)